MAEILPLLFAILIFALLLAVYFIKAKTKISIPPVIAQEGIRVPIINAYQGTWFINVHNGLWSSLTLFEDHFEFVVLSKKTVNFTEIKSVDIRFGFLAGGSGLNIVFNNGAWNYCAVMNKHNLREVLLYFKAKGCALSQKAEDFVSQNFNLKS